MEEFNSNYWNNWQGICEDFAEEIPEPNEVLFSDYTYENYSGDVFVLGRYGDQYFLTEGGHCSCYGLEGQWNSEMYELKFLIAALERRFSGRYNSGLLYTYYEDIMKELRKRID